MRNQSAQNNSGMLKIFGGLAVILVLVGVLYIQTSSAPTDNVALNSMSSEAEAATRCDPSSIGGLTDNGPVPPRGARSVSGMPLSMAKAVDVWIPTGAYSMSKKAIDKTGYNYSMHLYLPPELEGKCAYLASVDDFHTTRFWGAEILGRHAAKGDYGEATEQVYVPTTVKDSKDGYYVIVETDDKLVGYFWTFGRNP